MFASVQTVGDCPQDQCEMFLLFAGDASEMRTALVLVLLWLGLDLLQNG